MRTETPVLVRLDDYCLSDYLIDTVSLDIHLHSTSSTIRADVTVRPNPESKSPQKLVLDGDETVLVQAWLDGTPLEEGDYEASPKGFTLHHPPQQPFVLRLETRVDPSANTQLSGLYRSNGVYCTQCEAEGFRRITYFLDRPDILSVYTTRIEADLQEAPVLLGNGNCTASGPVGTGRHYAIWHDPHPKPCYLFALVGGDLDSLKSPFRTMNGRDVMLGIYVEKGKVGRADYAMDALKRSMIWDERAFGREYDLDVFNIVAVSDFNMGAMENKGLNIFNDKYILASPDTATDTDYAAIEAIIAHEYFHNWTGNRITCRDWFQLCLKEGLTVFRDQEFSSDERSRAVHRIGEVRNLRARQFAEDAGPLAHSVRPRQYQEINNFYTATVYDKGAEIVRMLKGLVGAKAFAAGIKLYFERCDGTAATVEDFLACFAQVSNRDLSSFARWYEQAGTPHVLVTGHYDAAAQTYRLDLAQSTPATPGQDDKEPMVLPVRIGLVSLNGTGPLGHCAELNEDGLYVMDHASTSLVFTGVSSRPVPSVFRDFSAPVKVSLSLSDDDLMALLRHDSDPFNRWQAGQNVMMRVLLKQVDGLTAPVDAIAQSLGAFLEKDALHDPAFAALMMAVPIEGEIAQEIGSHIDPSLIHLVRRSFKKQLCTRLLPRLEALREALGQDEVYSPDAASAGRRALRNMCLDGLAAADVHRGEAACAEHYQRATNMTDRMAAMMIMAQIKSEAREELFRRFETDYRDEPLALDKWFALQSSLPEDAVLERIEALMLHPAFSWSNPNRLRSVVGSFAMNNPSQFNRADGKGYAFLADIIIKIDPTNPQVASRLMTAFSAWRTMETQRKEKAKRMLERIASTPHLSRDTDDIVRRSLKE
jgi:aminopeptidase N